MLKSLKFVQGAVSKKDFLPALTHFRIENGTVRSYNGVLGLCSPIPLNINCTPKAETLVKAIGHCDETVSLSITATGRLSVRSGSFKALIDCVTHDTPHVTPEGDMVEINGASLLKALEVIQPFIGDDASRPWSNGVLFKGQSCFATNNVTLVEYWTGTPFPRVCNVPRACVKEMLRIGEVPTGAQFGENNVTFHYPEGRWLRTQLFETSWPDLDPILNRQPVAMGPLDSRLFEGLVKMKPFVDKLGRIYIRGGIVSTNQNSEEGAEFIIPGMDTEGLFNIEMLQLLEGVATSVDFASYPSPCLFYGENLRGAIVGMRPA